MPSDHHQLLRFPLRCCVLLLAFAASATAAEPTITSITPLGLEIGKTTTLTISGTGLAANPRLLLSTPIAKQEVQQGGNDRQVKIDVTLAEDLQAGYSNLWLVTDEGVSAVSILPIDCLPDRAWSEEAGELPVALTTRVAGSAILKTKISGKKGERLQVEVESLRLGGAVRPVVHLVDARHLQLAYAMPSVDLYGDCRLETTLPADGEYWVEVHDAQYAGGGTVPVRVKIGSWEYADQVFPPAVAAQTPAEVELVGHVSGGSLKLPASTAALELLNWPAKCKASGPRPWVRVSADQELLEARQGTNAQVLDSVPVNVSGRIATPGENDLYELAVKEGDELNLEVFADRWGSPLAAVLEVKTPEGRSLGKADDATGTTDPQLTFKVPAKVERIVVSVRDLYDRGSPECIYRLAVVAGAKQLPSSDAWKLVLPAAHLTVPAGGRAILPVQLHNGLAEPVALQLASAGLKLKVAKTEIPIESTGALLEISAPANFKEAAVVRLQGSQGGRQVPALAEKHAAEKLQPWLAEELAIAAGPASPLSLDWKDASAATLLVLADKTELAVAWTFAEPKPAGGEETKETPAPAKPGPVQLSLLVGQIVPEVNGRPNPALTIRAEKAVEVPLADGAGSLVALVPNILNGQAYDVAVEAKLMSADKKQVLATAVTPVRRIATKNPLALELAGDASLKITPGQEIEIAGKVTRYKTHQGPVTVTLKDFPAGFAAPAVTVKPEEEKFVVKLKAPANAKPGDTATLNLTGAGPPNPKAANVTVTSEQVKLQLQVVAAPETDKK